MVVMVMTDSRREDREVTVFILHLHQNSTGLYEDSQASHLVLLRTAGLRQ